MQLTRPKTNKIILDNFFIELFKTQLVFIEFRKLANAVSGYKSRIFF